ncbi:hypothetical protein WCT79_19220 [Pectobacterium carotovorum]|uniref:hypothetical protein n=1 Tax=Pectobacterium carotovorum TaxID=554 RepID=UPI00301960C5
MKCVIAAMMALSSMSASADCWVVEEMKGTSFSERNAYKAESDGFGGTFMLSINGDMASVKYSGSDAGGVVYHALSPTSIIGLSSEGDTKRVVDSWVIQPDGKVLMSKTITGFGEFDSVKAFVGKVKSKC